MGHLADDADRLRAILDGMTEAVCRFKPDGTIVFVNEAYCRLVGRSREEVVGSTYAPIIHPDDIDRVAEELQVLSPESPAVVIENRITTTSGEVRWTQWTNRGFFDANGELVECQSAARDITEQVAAQAALRRSHEELRFLAEASQDLAASLDAERTLQAVAQSAVPFLADGCTVAVFDQERAGTYQRLAFAHVDPELERAVQERNEVSQTEEVPAELRPLFDRLKAGEPVLVAELDRTDVEAMGLSEGQLRLVRMQDPCSHMLVPMAARGKVLGSITFTSSRRHSDRRYCEADLALAGELGHRAGMALDNARLYAERREMDRRKDEFIAVLSHELRNPLAAIVTALELIRSSDDPRGREQALSIAQRQARNQSRLVDDLLEVSRLLRGSIDLALETVDLRERLKAAVEIQHRSRERPGRVKLELPSEPVWASVDPMRFEQIVGNLLDNARKYSPEDTTITCTLDREGPVTRVRVRDRGAGLAPESLAQVFEPFEQLGPRHARSEGGLGLGLTIVRELAELHRGSVSAASEGPGRGAEFTVELPALDRPAEDAVREPVAHPEGRPSRVLVVDDNADAADALAELLALWGHEVRAAYGGEEALAAAVSFDPDVALVDVGMPGTDGYETARRWRERADGQERRARLVALTGYAQPHDVARALDAGFDEHLAKPARPEALRRVLELRRSAT